MPRISFDEWKKAVDDAIASKLYGMTSDDLPDYCYRDAYDENKTPKSVASKAIKAAQDY